MGDGFQKLRFDEFELDEANARLTRAGRPVQLPPKAFSVLCVLIREPGRLTRKDALLDAVWGRRYVSESVLKTTVSQLRAALADDAGEPHYIETVSRHGYRFIGTLVSADATVHRAAESPSPAAATPAIIGRADALQRMRRAWARALGGERQLVWVVGEAGVGKSTLIKRFSSELPADALVVGHCVEHFGTGEPYLPLLEALRELCSREPDLPMLIRAVAPTWIMQMPWLISEADRAGLQRDLAGAHPERMVREMRELLDRITAQRPLLLVLEDLHWSDLGTLRMMEHFARQPRPIRMLWIASFRLTQVIAEEHPLRELRQELRLHRLCDEIQLDPFSESEVNAYLESRIPAAGIDEDFVRRLHAHTEGLPLFVANVTDSLLAQGAFASHVHDAISVPLPVPDNLAGVIEKQIERLTGDLQRVLEAASVCGVEFRAATLASLIGRDALWVSQQCDDLVRRRLWLRHAGIVELPDGGFDSRYEFLHALYQHVCYQRIPASQRVQYHRQVAAGIEARRASGEDIAASELASHYERGHESMAALRAYGVAAQNALAHFAPKDAEQLAAHGLSLLHRCPDSTHRMELELELVRAAGVAASLLHGLASSEACVASERVRQLCELLPQTPQRAASLTGLAWIAYVRGEFAAALALGRRLEEIARRFDDAVLFVSACNLTGVSLVALGEFAVARQSLQLGIDRCQTMDQQVPPAAFIIDPEVSMRANLAVPLADCGLADQARSHLQHASSRAARIGQPIAMMLANWAGGMVHVRLNDPDKVAQHAAALAKVVESAMLTQGEGPSLWLRGWAEAHRGEPRRGYERILQGYACHARLGMYAGCPEVLSYAVEALILAGDWPAAQRQLEETLQLAENIGEKLILANAHLLGARIALGCKDQARARVLLRESIRVARKQQALGVELKALYALARLDDCSMADLAELETAYRKMTEGFDTSSYVLAGELLMSRA